MKHSLFFYIKPFLVISAILLGICCLVEMPTSLNGWLGYIGIVEPLMCLLSFLYIKWIWRYCFWENIPRFSEKYNGTIYYTHEGGGTKSTEIFISQTIFSTRVKIKTDEITSDTITSDLVEENGSWFLYYTYITNPKAVYADKNPVQHGTARLEIEKPKYNLKTWFFKHKNPVKSLTGKYWTTRNTTGDMVFQKEDDK